MSRVWKTCVPLLLLVVWCASAWAAATPTPRYKMGTKRLPPVDERGPFQPAERVWGVPYQVGATAGPGTQMGLTYYDYQHNGSVGRQVDEFGGKIQCSWMKAPSASPSVRDIRWNVVSVTGSPTNFVLDNGNVIKRLPVGTPLITGGQAFTATRPGYTNYRNRPSGRALVIYHDAPEEAIVQELWTQMDQSVGSGLFTGVQIPEPVDPKYSADAIIWPKLAVSVVGADTIFHAVGGWFGGDEVWYFRGVQTAANAATWAVGVMLDANGSNITPIVEANGSEVTVVYLKQFNSTNLDVVYRRSTNGGVSWGPVVNVTNYTSGDPDGANQDVNAVYDMSGNLHII